MPGKVSNSAADLRVSRRQAMALGAGAIAAWMLPICLTPVSAQAGQVSSSMHAALGEFLEANCRYHRAYRAFPTGRMVITPPAVRREWMAANVELRRAVNAVMSVPSTSAEDVRMKIRAKGLFFMKECPPESYWALSEALRWQAVIDRDAAVFGVSLPITSPEFA